MPSGATRGLCLVAGKWWHRSLSLGARLSDDRVSSDAFAGIYRLTPARNILVSVNTAYMARRGGLSLFGCGFTAVRG